jgi:hypothetical protein
MVRLVVSAASWWPKCRYYQKKKKGKKKNRVRLMLDKTKTKGRFLFIFKLKIKELRKKTLSGACGTHVCVRIVITHKSATCINWNSGGFKESSQVWRGEVENCI